MTRSWPLATLALVAGLFGPAAVAAPSLNVLTKEYAGYTGAGIEPQCEKMIDTTSVAYHTPTAKLYVSTDRGCIAEVDPNTLNIIRSKFLQRGAAHELASDGQHIYVQTIFDRPAKKHKVMKIDPGAASGLGVISEREIANATGSPEGFVFLGDNVFIAVGGYDHQPGRLPGKIVKLRRSDLAILATWTIPTADNGPNNENHGFTTDGTNLFALTAPQRWVKNDRIYKLNQSLARLASRQFSVRGSLGGNVFLGGKVYSSGGKLWKINPSNLAVDAGQGCTVHWLATDNTYIYRVGRKYTGSGCNDGKTGSSTGVIEVVNPTNMSVLLTHVTPWPHLHFGIVANGFLWVAFENSGDITPLPGRIGRYRFQP